jgi:hypothetical protein
MPNILARDHPVHKLLQLALLFYLLTLESRLGA